MSVATVGVVAAIALPRMAHATGRARYQMMLGNEQAMQRAVDLYATDHRGRNPAQNDDGSVTTDRAVVVARLLGRTDEFGVVGPGGFLGPYLSAVPKNPYSACRHLRIDGDPDGAGCAWRLRSVNGSVKGDHADAGETRFWLLKPRADGAYALGAGHPPVNEAETPALGGGGGGDGGGSVVNLGGQSAPASLQSPLVIPD